MSKQPIFQRHDIDLHFMGYELLCECYGYRLLSFTMRLNQSSTLTEVNEELIIRIKNELACSKIPRQQFFAREFDNYELEMVNALLFITLALFCMEKTSITRGK